MWLNFSDPTVLNLDKTKFLPEKVVIPKNYPAGSWVYLVITSFPPQDLEDRDRLFVPAAHPVRPSHPLPPFLPILFLYRVTNAKNNSYISTATTLPSSNNPANITATPPSNPNSTTLHVAMSSSSPLTASSLLDSRPTTQAHGLFIATLHGTPLPV